MRLPFTSPVQGPCYIPGYFSSFELFRACVVVPTRGGTDLAIEHWFYCVLTAARSNVLAC
jgi:hypothetical protein